ncbi:MAG: rubrerythrin family protein [Promethearchaeota archaeon Loki_b31]|nr:MAG: rubrerythrin family protein [Candidatus Lokiarchaeota archaeon Loki_b31]
MNETPKKLFAAYVGESQARNRYTFFASIAKKEGYVLISRIFQETADQEREHGLNFYKMLQEFKKEENFDDFLVNEMYPTTYGKTIENLKSAVNGETMEYTKLYPDLADTAEKEGYPHIAERTRAIARAEQHHAERYGKLLKLIGDDAFFKRGEKVVWVCLECGYEVELDELPKDFDCPSCSHPRSYFRKKCEVF